MNAFSSDVIDRLGWVLVHSLRQFAIAAIMAALIVAVLRRRSATSRYAVLVIAMLMLVIAPCATWIMFPASGWASALRVNTINTDLDATVILETSTNNSAISTPLEADAEVGATMPESQSALEFGAVDSIDQTRRADAQPLAEVAWIELVRPWFSWIVGSWLTGVFLCSLRPLLGWRMFRRLRRIGIGPPSDEVLAVFARVSQRLGLRRSVQIFHSTLAAGPLVVGYLKPIVLLPVSLVCSIPLSQLEAILAHELAHIRRHDFVINLAQTLMETLFFYHPAIWWLSRRIRIEREHCCDDLVVKLFDNGVDYGRALVAIEQLKSQRTVLALGARDGSLLGRIRRITSMKTESPRVPPPWSVCLTALVLAITLSSESYFDGRSEGGITTIEEPGSDKDNAETDGLWTAEVPGGGKIQLVALSLPGKDLGHWWSPDGAPVLHADRFPDTSFLSLGLIAVRVWEPRSDRCFLNEGAGRSIGNQSDFIDPLSKNDLAQFAVMGLEPSGILKSRELRIGAGFGEWKTVGEVPFEESKTAFDEVNTAILVNGEDVQLQSIHDVLENKTHAWATIICRTQDKLNLDFTGIAITKDGRELPNICNPSVHLSKPDGTTQLIFDALSDDIVRLVVKARKIHWVVFDGICVEPGKGTNLKDSAESFLSKTQQLIRADLPTGVGVQLAGVTIPIVLTEDQLKQGIGGALAPLPTAENPDTREWWSGNGLQLATAPEPGQSWMVRKGWEDGRQFAFEISGLPDADSELNVVMFHDRAAERQQAVMIEVSKSQLDPGKRIILGSIAPDADAVSAALELRIGTGKSATVKFDTDGKRTDSLDDEAALHSESMKKIIEEIKFLRIVQKGNDVDVWTRPITTNGQLGSVRYSVVDKTGTSHSSPGGYSMNDEQLTPFKNLTVADIREVHFEIRAFDHSVMFENVSRKLGTKSEVKVTVAPLPKPPEPIQVRLPNNEMIELLGVSTPPIEPPFKDKREWWKGDGTPMEMAPIPMGSIYVGASESDGREFVVRASNFAGQFPMDVTLKERFKEGQPYKPEGNGWSQSSTQSGPIDENQKDKWQVTSEYVAGPVGDADSATLEVRVGSKAKKGTFSILFGTAVAAEFRMKDEALVFDR